MSAQPVRGVYRSINHPDLMVIDKVNGGKADAINAGINAAKHPLVCVIDADSLLEEHALTRAVLPFLEDPTTVAAGGIIRIANGCRVEDGRVVEVGLPSSRLACFQVTEYLRAFLAGRVAQSTMQALLIISGAFGIFRRDALLASARASVARIGAVPGDAWLCVLPAGHISGIQVMTRALVTGTEAVHAAFDTDAVMELVRRLRPHVSLVPTQLRRLLAAGADLSLFGTILLGGAAAEPPLLEAARAAGARVVTTYGMSETCGGCVYDGVPLEGTLVRTAHASSGEPGRVLLSGPALLTGYRLPPGAAGMGWGNLRLGRYGKLVVERDPVNPRTKRVRLTPEAQRTRDAYAPLVAEIERRWQGQYGEDFIRTVRAALEPMVIELGGGLAHFPTVVWIGGIFTEGSRPTHQSAKSPETSGGC